MTDFQNLKESNGFAAKLWRGGKNASRNRLDFGRLVFGGS